MPTTKNVLKPLLIASTRHSAYPDSKILTDTSQALRLGNRIFWLDGSVVLSGRAVINTEGLSNTLPPEVAFWTVEKIADWWSRSARNVGALFIQDLAEHWSACMPDPLGGAIAFYSTESGSTVISTDINEIVKYYKSINSPLEKDPLFQVERIVFGNGGLVNSSYEKVRSIQPFEYLVVQLNVLNIKKYSIFDDLIQHSYNELFQQLKADILSSVSAVLDSPVNQKIAHVTGGFDSRLVLAAASALGRTSELAFFCSGPPGTTDRIVADSLTHEYNLRRVSGAGLTPAPTNLMAERLLGPLFASGGITSSGPIGREHSVSVSALGGGYGEVLRTFYGQRTIADTNGKLSLEHIRDSYLKIDPNLQSNISRDSSARLEKLLFTKFQNLEELFGDVSFVGDAHYTYGRNRYHIGQNSLLWSRIGARFDPLYSVAGFALAAKSTQSVRYGNVIGFDLMDSFDRTLLEHKFDYDRFNDSLTTMRQRPVQRELTRVKTLNPFESTASPEYSESSDFLGILTGLKAQQPQVTATQRQEIIEKSNKMGVNYWQLLNKQVGQQILEAAYNNAQNESIFDHFNQKYVVELFSKKELNRQQLRDLYNIGGIISWLSFG